MQGGNQPATDDSSADPIDQHIESHAQAETGELNRYSPEGENSRMDIAPDAVDDAVITWEASEYIHHQKNGFWYLGFAGVVILAGTIVYLLISDIFSVVILGLMALALGTYAGRKPKVQRYSLSHSGLTIGTRHYGFDEFRSYSLNEEGSVLSATFTPLKRFMPPVSIYLLPQDAPRVAGVLDQALPHEEYKPDIIDRLFKIIRF